MFAPSNAQLVELVHEVVATSKNWYAVDQYELLLEVCTQLFSPKQQAITAMWLLDNSKMRQEEETKRGA